MPSLYCTKFAPISCVLRYNHGVPSTTPLALVVFPAYNALSLAVAREFKRDSADQVTVVKNSRGISYVQIELKKPLKEVTRRR